MLANLIAFAGQHLLLHIMAEAAGCESQGSFAAESGVSPPDASALIAQHAFSVMASCFCSRVKEAHVALRNGPGVVGLMGVGDGFAVPENIILRFGPRVVQCIWFGSHKNNASFDQVCYCRCLGYLPSWFHNSNSVFDDIMCLPILLQYEKNLHLPVSKGHSMIKLLDKCNYF